MGTSFTVLDHIRVIKCDYQLSVSISDCADVLLLRSSVHSVSSIQRRDGCMLDGAELSSDMTVEENCLLFIYCYSRSKRLHYTKFTL